MWNAPKSRPQVSWNSRIWDNMSMIYRNINITKQWISWVFRFLLPGSPTEHALHPRFGELHPVWHTCSFGKRGREPWCHLGSSPSEGNLQARHPHHGEVGRFDHWMVQGLQAARLKVNEVIRCDQRGWFEESAWGWFRMYQEQCKDRWSIVKLLFWTSQITI